MVVLLIHFHGKIGPRIFMKYPLVEITKDIQNVTRFMDIKHEEGFILTNEELADSVSRNLNYAFSINSPLNIRGKTEELLLSYIITETDPEVDFYRKKILKTVNNLKNEKKLYLAFHQKEGGEKKKEFILNELKALDSELRKKEISTTGYIESKKNINERGTIPVPIQEDWEDGINYLLVYKKETNGIIKLTGYPTRAKNVYKMGIYNDEFKTEEYQIIIKSFRDIGAKIITSSGICQGKSVQGKSICLFEAYFEYDGDKNDIKEMQEKLIKNITSGDPNYPMIVSSDVTTGSFLSATSQK